MNSLPKRFEKAQLKASEFLMFQVGLNKVLRKDGLSLTNFPSNAKDYSEIPESLMEKYKALTGKNLMDQDIKKAQEDFFSFNIPVFEGDESIDLIHGESLSIYRKVKNNNQLYFDSFIPLSQFVLRKRMPWSYIDIFSMSHEESLSIIEFSNSLESNLVPINRIETDFKNYIMIRMKYLDPDQYMPLVSETTTFTNEESAKRQALAFNSIVENPDLLGEIYDNLSYLIKNMPEKTGYVLSDLSLNNIVASKDLDKFVFIDVLDIKRKREKKIHDISEVFTMTKQRLHPDFLANLSEKAKKFFPSYEYKKDPENQEAWENFKDNIFNEIKRSRFIMGY
mgnify:CR=1 FL=1